MQRRYDWERGCGEGDLLYAIKRMAVRESNPMVHEAEGKTAIQECTEEMYNAKVSFVEDMLRDQAVYELRSLDNKAEI